MRRALELAAHGRGHVEPNPLVGAVIVRDGVVVGEGWHQRFGEAHAEIHALTQAGAAARGATLFVTLEPCCHQGKTPPCTDAIVAAGIARVVAAMRDPYPQVAGVGAERLRAAGIPVDLGSCETEARRLNAPYLKLIHTGLPFVHAKWAMTLDGKIASRAGDSKWISNESSRRRTHQLRGRMDAVIVGIGTALADDPLLTARPAGPRTPCRVLFDSQARLPLTSKLATTARQTPMLIVAAEQAPAERIAGLRATGCEVLALPGRPDVLGLLRELGRRRFTNVLLEGGSALLGSFLDAAAIDAVHAFIALKLLGGNHAMSPIAGHGIERIADALPFAHWQVHDLDGDAYIAGEREPHW
ncbi:MAG: bifunctional diaminohydroxyphosphoribosylaminopyrimidine deaminase/5-amino-6-(5-phosphoribosylamino)uracil reductase RibD [Planctomycetes bacterium]|nr:bifunctional diaminohydroxyphosphoribosylaminopyrimidine deaminase/5-amino-6-(5-phosphoribosylamino)uracil reductase RibD [Planctomycetota bacterium]